MTTEPTPADIHATRGPVLLEFGSESCPICRATYPLIERALTQFPDVPHFKIEDGKGKPLGRAFAVKLWPTLVFLRDGKEATRLVRPGTAEELRQALALVANAPPIFMG